MRISCGLEASVCRLCLHLSCAPPHPWALFGFWGWGSGLIGLNYCGAVPFSIFTGMSCFGYKLKAVPCKTLEDAHEVMWGLSLTNFGVCFRPRGFGQKFVEVISSACQVQAPGRRRRQELHSLLRLRETLPREPRRHTTRKPQNFSIKPGLVPQHRTGRFEHKGPWRRWDSQGTKYLDSDTGFRNSH